MANILPFRDINVHSSSSYYAFTSPSSPSSPTLVIDRPSGDLRLNDGALLGGKRVSSIYGILGMIKLRLDKYVIVITKAQPMGRLKGHTVYKVLATEFLPMREKPLHDADEDTYLSLLRTFIKSGPMYFSYTLDLTNSFQRQAYADPSLPLWKRTDDRFFWNKHISRPLIDFRQTGTRHQHGPQPGADPYILPVIFGMLEIRPTSVKNTPLTLALITRRSRHRAGTRYFSRGLDEAGHVSNYNETEQIVVLNDNSSGLGGFAGGSDIKVCGSNGGRETQVMAYVQTRGSVPVYWAEINTLSYTPKLQIRGIESAQSAAKLHFDEQIRLYGPNYLVNLVNQKGREQRVKEAYEAIVKLLVSSPAEAKSSDAITDEKFHVVEPASSSSKQEFDKLHYIYFDFHNETKGLKWHRAQLLLDQMHDALIQQGYFRGVDMPGNQERIEIRSQQNSVVRTNCMDCLDRTNVVQSMLARFALNRMFVDCGILAQGEIFQTAEPAFEFLFRNVWADNADVVSRSYSGTGALKTDFTRTGNRTKAGALQDLRNSITRYVRNNFFDGEKQDAFDLFLGAYEVDEYGGGVFVDRRPLMIQAVPYVLLFAVCMVLFGLFAPVEGRTRMGVRIFLLVFVVVSAWAGNFVKAHGGLYVNWPKLITRPWAIEGYNEAIQKARKDKLVGQFVAQHERGISTARFLNAEEGKKRIE